MAWKDKNQSLGKKVFSAHPGSNLQPLACFAVMLRPRLRFLKTWPVRHTDPVCQIFSKNSFNGKIASKLFKFEWFGIFKTSEGKENWKKGQKNFWRPNKGQRSKNPNFHIFFDFLRLIGSKNSCGAIFFHFRSHKGQKDHYKAKS